jgi:anti-sigma factor RsiW
MDQEPFPNESPITCREVTSFIADYLAGELQGDAHRAFEHHLSLCPNCVQYVADYRRAVALGRGAYAGDPAAVAEDVPTELVTAILAARRAGR